LIADSLEPTASASPEPFSGKATALQSFPFPVDSGRFGRELTAPQELANIAALFPTAPVGGGSYWRYTPTEPEDSLIDPRQFVPLFYHAADVTQENLDAASTSTWIMGFNEPDLPRQADMTVSQALALWPQLEATGAKLVSPACASNMVADGSWCASFITGNGGSYIPRLEALAVHHYVRTFTDPSGTELLFYIDAIWNKWHKPIWLTEFGMIHFTGNDIAGWTYPTVEQARAYMSNVVPKLRERMGKGEVMRFAWYPDAFSQAALDTYGDTGIGNITLANPDGSLTSLGVTYSGL
jgi:hypothetical protein